LEVKGGQNKEKVFKTLDELIEVYRKMSVLSRPFSSSLPKRSWFFGDLTGEEADQLLAGQPAGTFLIRFSHQPGCYAASFVGTGGQNLKGLVTKTGNGFQVNQMGMIFGSLDELVAHYQSQKIFTTPFQH